ncbi:MAG: hypothetical protein HC875_35980 [Anaerolineales bacterium]|nr:hypothetical protein [Anaerolineales bacterium]
MLSLITRRRPHLLPLDALARNIQPEQVTYLGLQDVPLKNIVGSAGRHRDYTQRFSPCASDERSKERWRLIYTLVVSGAGFPPIEVYQVGDVYFVQNGHHRVSVATYLGWPDIQAYVTVLPAPRLKDLPFTHQLH